VLSGAVQAVAGDSLAEAIAGIENRGHPHAAEVARMLSGGTAVGFRAAPEPDTLYQLKITVRGRTARTQTILFVIVAYNAGYDLP
jgi:adenine/guanine phosphoribosyltransferase-like PRPP-binding protein